ncbi:c-type cytochrome [Gallaecimonas mangrovi]|uniref:c-type cytochrome n=1 Tax=Gallaecimonas mangrovi TaxID=2291597 RepID=UPI0030101BEA
MLIAIVAVVIIGLLGSVWLNVRQPASPFKSSDAAPLNSQAWIDRGEYVARLGDCVACHSTADSKPFSGGLKMGTPLGAIYTTNITPDSATGIGQYSLSDFDRAVRHGVAKDGHHLYPAMPYPSYQKLSDDDIKALYAYFMHGVKPVTQANKASEISWPMNMRWPLAWWNLLFTDGKAFTPTSGKSAQWNRGAYLVQGPGHCGSCHTPRGVAMNEKALDETSNRYLSGALLDGWYAPSLRNDPNRGLGRWSEQDIYQFLKTGRNDHAVVFGSMTDAFNNSTQFMSDDDLRAIATYLKSLPANPEQDDKPWQYDNSTQQALTAANRGQVAGAQHYAEKCGFCHGLDGRGKKPWIPPLAGATSMLIAAPDSAINVVLNGSGRVGAGGLPDAYRMPPYRGQLNDAQLAKLLTFVRSSWGNSGGKVSAGEVKALREHTNPASIDLIILQMR